MERLSFDRWEDGAGAGMVGMAAGKSGWRNATAAAMVSGYNIGGFFVVRQLTGWLAQVFSWDSVSFACWTMIPSRGKAG